MKKIAMVVFSSYPLDVRVRREAEALVRAGMSVDVLCRTSRGELHKENVNSVTAYRLTLKRRRAGKMSYIFEYGVFFIWAFFKLTLLNAKNNYDIVHIHNMPDFLVFTALIPRIFGTKIVLDLHDPMPELFASMVNVDENNIISKILRFNEKISIKFANLVLTPNLAFKELFILRGCPESKIHIIMNSPDENIFKTNYKVERDKKYKDKFLLMYHGAVVERHGLDLAMKAISSLRDKIPNLLMVIYGEGNFLQNVKDIVQEENLQNIVELKGMVLVDEIAEFIPQIDLGIIPNRINAFTQLNFPVRIFEYLINKKPVSVPKTKGISDYFEDESIYFFEPGNITELAATIYRIYSDNGEKTKIINNAYNVYRKYSWQAQQEKLVKLETNLSNK
jgi:glycosyltransferase involved in cell wall biosynthesis